MRNISNTIKSTKISRNKKNLKLNIHNSQLISPNNLIFKKSPAAEETKLEKELQLTDK